jgi:hypothetical protein
MSETIRVDKDILESQIERLQRFVHVAWPTPFDPFVKSTGANVIILEELQEVLEDTVAAFYTLAERTFHLLKNTNTTFIEADEGLAYVMDYCRERGEIDRYLCSGELAELQNP